MTIREALKLYPDVRAVATVAPSMCYEVLSTLAEAYYDLAERDREDERAIDRRAERVQHGGD